jgi:hypothetical protein
MARDREKPQVFRVIAGPALAALEQRIGLAHVARFEGATRIAQQPLCALGQIGEARIELRGRFGIAGRARRRLGLGKAHRGFGRNKVGPRA